MKPHPTSSIKTAIKIVSDSTNLVTKTYFVVFSSCCLLSAVEPAESCILSAPRVDL